MPITLTMNSKERERLKVLERIAQLEITDADAAQILQISMRQLYRLKARCRNDGDQGLVHRLRGKASNRGYDQKTRQQVEQLYRERYSDYGPQLFSEMLREHHELEFAPETLRSWLISAGLWSRKQRRRRHRRKRARRQAIGELVQFDGSPHDWFEGRGASCCLLVAIDDASSRVFMRFASSENTHDALETMKLYVGRYGIPQAIYTDGGTVYYSDSGAPTDFARAMERLGIVMIHAHSPQAKGRVERSNRTQQDRLIKALRRAGISSIEQANGFLEASYLNEHNERFASTTDLLDVHRSAEGVDLANIFCFECERVVNNDWTVRLDSEYLQLSSTNAALPPPKQRVQIRRYLDGSLHIFWQQQELKFTIFEDKPANLPRLAPQPKPEHPWRKFGRLGTKKTSKSRAKT